MEKTYDLWVKYLKTSFFSSLDGLRCLSIIAVIWHHSGVAGETSIPILKKGFLGVDIFFVISGFLIVTLILREKERNQSFSIKNFYIRRSLRIFPPYYLLLLILSIFFIMTGKNSSQSSDFFTELPFLVTYTSNWVEITTFLGITWSLSTEEQFYIIWPTIERYFSYLVPFLLPLFLFVNILFLYQYIDIESIIGVNYSDLEILQVTFTPILLGVLLAYLLNREKSFYYISMIINKQWSSLLYLFAVCLVANSTNDLVGTPRLLIHIFAMLMIASCVVNEKDWLSNFLTIRFVARIGVVSYGMYLYHMIAIHFIRVFSYKITFIQYMPIFFMLSVLATYCIAELSYNGFEKKMLRLKHRFMSPAFKLDKKESIFVDRD
jgi:peptidoglycan/LPS O-acetylase OafA/YrhL